MSERGIPELGAFYIPCAIFGGMSEQLVEELEDLANLSDDPVSAYTASLKCGAQLNCSKILEIGIDPEGTGCIVNDIGVCPVEIGITN